MPIGIGASDQKLLLAGGAVILIFIIATALLSPPPEQLESPIPSTYSTQPAGAQAAFRLLVRLRYPVRRWESPPTELDDDPEGVLLILAEPWQPPSAKEKDALANFVQDGGHVLFTGDAIREYFPDADLSNRVNSSSQKSFSSDLPTRITRGAKQINLKPQALWKTLDSDQLQLYGDEESPVVISWTYGEGNILWWAGSTPLTNAGITKDDNLAFFLNSVGQWNLERPYKIYWDEYFHGQRSSLWSYVEKTSVKWSVWQLAILAFAVILTFSRRSGPVFVPPQVSRLSPLEFVDTLGGLYERAGAASSAISISAMRLRGLLTRHLGLPNNTANDVLAHAAATRLGWKEAELQEALSDAEAARRAFKIPSQKALTVVRKLEDFIAKLDVRAQLRREKT
jgi:hypothetical protein